MKTNKKSRLSLLGRVKSTDSSCRSWDGARGRDVPHVARGFASRLVRDSMISTDRSRERPLRSLAILLLLAVSLLLTAALTSSHRGVATRLLDACSSGTSLGCNEKQQGKIYEYGADSPHTDSELGPGGWAILPSADVLFGGWITDFWGTISAPFTARGRRPTPHPSS